MRIFRYKIIVDNTERILSVGVEKSKVEVARNKTSWGHYPTISVFPTALSDNQMVDLTSITITAVVPRVKYSFTHSILSIEDKGKLNLKREKSMLEGRLCKVKYISEDFEIPKVIDNNMVTKSVARGYAIHIMRTVIAKLKDVKNKEIKIEDYILE